MVIILGCIFAYPNYSVFFLISSTRICGFIIFDILIVGASKIEVLKKKIKLDFNRDCYFHFKKNLFKIKNKMDLTEIFLTFLPVKVRSHQIDKMSFECIADRISCRCNIHQYLQPSLALMHLILVA